MKLFNALVAVVLAVSALQAQAQDVSSAPAEKGPGAEIVTIRMKDGSTLHARIVDRTAGHLKLVTVSGVAVAIPETLIESVDDAARADSGERPSDSNTTRLLFSPTGRPLRKGEGYFSDHFLVFPGVAYGLTDNLSVGAGVSVIPGLGLDEQLFYVAPRFGKQFSETLAMSAGLLVAHAGTADEEGNLGVGFAMATLGKPDKSLTVGLGVARTLNRETTTRFVNGAPQFETQTRATHTPVLILGGTARLTNRIALVSENWLVLHENFKLSEQPFAVGLRFLGDRLSADVGVILVGEVIEQGFPIPWVSVTYHLGRNR